MEKILIIDDDFNNRDILRIRLERAGYQVLEAENGDDGLNIASKENINLIILDVMMPKKDGWLVCKMLKDNAKTQEIPVIILTARSLPIDELRSLECGADGYVPKPIDHILLLKNVEELLKKHKTV